MTIKEIIQKLYTAVTDACLQESHFESWLILNEGIIDAIDALKALDNQEPVAWTVQRCYDDGTPHPCRLLEWAGRNAEDDFPIGTKFYTAPPQRAWVELTREERDAIFELHHTRLGGLDYRGDEVMYDEHFEDATTAIYAKLKQKNGYTEEKNT